MTAKCSMTRYHRTVKNDTSMIPWWYLKRIVLSGTGVLYCNLV